MNPELVILWLFLAGGGLVLTAAFWTSLSLLIVGGFLLVAAFVAGPVIDRQKTGHRR